ncbi:hypothetical protein AVEN_228558-1, partial [Araneus ventricosus]
YADLEEDIAARKLESEDEEKILKALWAREILYLDLRACDCNLIAKRKEPLRSISFSAVPKILKSIDRSIRAISRTDTASTSLETSCTRRW